MGALEQVFETMTGLDLFTLGFPFLVVLGLTYAALRRLDIFEEDSARGTTALGAAFISVGSIYVFFPDGLLLAFSATLTFALFAAFALVVVLGVAGVDLEEYLDEEGFPAIVAVTIVMFGLAGSFLYFVPVVELTAPVLELVGGGPGNGDFVGNVLQPILVLGFLAAVIYLVTSGGGEE